MTGWTVHPTYVQMFLACEAQNGADATGLWESNYIE